jgi:HPt (histidine-containing phosphotransfer) domain-containing protein
MSRQPTAEDLALLDPDGSFRLRLARDLEALVARDRENDTADEIATLVHRLAGAAETFGHTAVGRIAVALDDAFILARETGGPSPDVTPLIQVLQAVLAA